MAAGRPTYSGAPDPDPAAVDGNCDPGAHPANGTVRGITPVSCLPDRRQV
jgi:hypothetical protein